jgi:hypothetical protein
VKSNLTIKFLKYWFFSGNYTKFEKQAYYSQPSKKPPDNVDTFQALDLYLEIH